MTSNDVHARANRPLRHPADGPAEVPAAGAGTSAAATAPAWPSYTGTAQSVGTSSTGVTIFVDPSLGAPGHQNAQDLLAGADRVVQQNNAIFGTTGGAVSVIVFALNGKTDGTGGADHGGCDFTTGNAIEVDASLGSSARVTALFEAELSECTMNNRLCGLSTGEAELSECTMNNRLCGLSTGEALSRWCAAVVGANALADFATAPQWAQDGMPDWVDQTDSTDQSADSTGCGMAFLSWLLSQNHTLPVIAQAMVGLGDAGTLAALYAKLTGDPAQNAWSSFQAAVTGLSGGVTNDDPFNGLGSAGVS